MIPFVLALLGTAHAVEPQYRQLRLVDGRVFTAQILSTESNGLALQLPQGRTLVPFDLLVDMLPTDALTYQEQPDWSVWVIAEPPLRDEILAAFASIDGVRAAPVGDGAPDAVAQASRACGSAADEGAMPSPDEVVDCIAHVSADSGWRWLVVARDDGDAIRITSRTNAATDATRIDRITTEDRLDSEVYDLLGLERPYAPPPSVAVAPLPAVASPDETPEVPTIQRADRRKVLLQSFVPLPGYPSLRRGDTGGFLTAMGLVVPATAVWVGGVAQSGRSAGELTVLSAVGFYGATVLTNQVIGQRTLQRQRPALSLAPTERGGPQLVVGSRL